MNTLVALVSLAMAAPSALSLNCCIPELVAKIESLGVTGLLKQETEFGTYKTCVLSAKDAVDYPTVKGQFNEDETLSVTVYSTVEPSAFTTWVFYFKDNGDGTFDEINKATGETFTVYSIYSSKQFVIWYGCKKYGDCSDESHLVQCILPAGPNATDQYECQNKLNAVVQGFINTTNIC